jgi:hypothetical protein
MNQFYANPNPEISLIQKDRPVPTGNPIRGVRGKSLSGMDSVINLRILSEPYDFLVKMFNYDLNI